MAILYAYFSMLLPLILTRSVVSVKCLNKQRQTLKTGLKMSEKATIIQRQPPSETLKSYCSRSVQTITSLDPWVGK